VLEPNQRTGRGKHKSSKQQQQFDYDLGSLSDDDDDAADVCVTRETTPYQNAFAALLESRKRQTFCRRH
jgi:hypothetical protein